MNRAAIYRIIATVPPDCALLTALVCLLLAGGVL